MICKNCGNETENDVTYCSKCGKRIDGNKVCSFCKKEIPEESIFCTYCGNRVDGKTVCKICGEAYVGNFCPKCGTLKEKTVHNNNIENLNQKDKYYYKKILNYIKPSLFMASLLVMFICSFFVGLSLRTKNLGSLIPNDIIDFTGNINQSTSFFFLITQFKNISESLKSISPIYPELKIGIYLPAIINAIVVGVNIIICITYFIIGLVKFINGIKNKQNISMFKYLYIPLTSSLFTLCFIYSYYKSINISTSSSFINVSLSAGSTVNIILVPIFVCIGVILDLIIKGKTILNKKSILHYSLSFSMLIFAFVALIVIPKNLVSLKINDILIKANPLILLSGFLTALGETENITPEILKPLPWIISVFILFLIIFIIFTIIFATLLKSLQNKESQKKYSIMNISLSSACFVLSIVYLIISSLLVSKTKTPDLPVNIGSSSIIGLIMSLFILIICFINICINSKPQNINYNS